MTCEWIDPDEEMPQPGDRVLALYGSGKELSGKVVDISRGLSLRPTCQKCSPHKIDRSRIECWHPLPDPPEPDPTEKLPGTWREDPTSDVDWYFRQSGGFRVDVAEGDTQWTAEIEVQILDAVRVGDTPREAYDKLISEVRERFTKTLDALEGANE